MKPLVGISTRSQTREDILSHATPATYSRAIELAGGAPVLIPLRLGEDTLRDIFARLDGLLLHGGVDVDPKEYGAELSPSCGEIEPERDAVELLLLRWALNEKMPLLGICRGIQMINVAAGGTLYQDLSEYRPDALPHAHRPGEPFNRLVHSIEIDTTSRLAHMLGTTQIEVNSLHHQVLRKIASGFHVVARAPDGVIEGIEADDDRFAVGVQFHPEWLVDDDVRMLRIFESLVEASKKK